MNWISEYLELVESVSADQVFVALNQLAQRNAGAIIFTCSTFDSVTQQAMRIYTNQPGEYPVSGLKNVVENRWTRHVLDQGQTFVANETGGFADVFPDYELINSLGCHSVVNMPIIISGKVLGTVNLLHEAGYYTPERVQQVSEMKSAAMLAFLITANSSFQER